MKITSVVVTIKDESKDLSPETTSARYDAGTGFWVVDGYVFSRHLKVLQGITDLCREADKGIK